MRKVGYLRDSITQFRLSLILIFKVLQFSSASARRTRVPARKMVRLRMEFASLQISCISGLAATGMSGWTD
jgi:hypothetical protein